MGIGIHNKNPRRETTMNIKKLSEALEWCGIDHNIEQDDDDSIEIMVSDDNIDQIVELLISGSKHI
jgi:hypothetical protein